MKKITIFAFLLSGFWGFSQRNLTIAEATSGAYTSFRAENIVAPQWKNDKAFTHLSNDYQQLMVASADTNWKSNALLSKNDIQEALKQKFPSDTFSLNIFPYEYEWLSDGVIQFKVASKSHQYDVIYDSNSKKITSAFALGNDAKNQIFSKDRKYAAWLIDNNIVLTDEAGTLTQVTQDKDKAILNGSDYVHRQEFGINRGMWFSPDGKKLLYYRKDETMVAHYPLVDFSTRIATENDLKYPMAGEKSEEVTLVVFDIENKTYTTLQTGLPKEQYLTAVTWGADSETVYVGVLNRGQDHLKLNKYHAKDGKFIATLFEEKSNKYVEPQHPLYFNPANGNEFAYLTDKDGYRQFYLYNTNGKLLKKLGYQDVVVLEFIDFKDNKIWYKGTANKGLDNHLYAVDIKSGKTEKITDESGVHDTYLSTNKTYYIDQYSNTNIPNVVDVVATKSGKETNLLEAKNPYQGVIHMPKTEYITLKAADGKTDLNGRLIYPTNFDASKKYPVMIYVYGGPHAQLVTNSWLGGASLFDYYMAQQGFVVFTLDNRGSANRGRDFEQVIHRQLGVNEMADQMKGVEFLKSKSFVDADKIGVYGWSFGGFMATSLMLHHPEVFKVGVAGGPVIDWKWYEVMYGERYMDTPQDNPEGYAKTSTLDKVHNLKGRLLMIHGAQDPVVLQQHSMEFIEACIKAGKQVDYFLYPTHEHNVRGKDRIHLNEKIADYFITHLKK
ncbi:DPP IV N-terminal domain-containing protein [Bergeyella porcorum]|uniref:S9 family peptidase n=1 Tax=Bergeyella porcorum TaxID=1735111 RepID=UPI0035EE297B